MFPSRSLDSSRVAGRWLLALALAGLTLAAAPITAPVAAPVADLPRSPAEARRFLQQATFGPSAGDLASVSSLGYSGWIKAQLAAPRGGSFLAHMDARAAQLEAANAGRTGNPLKLGPNQFYEAFYQQAATAPDPLRQRVAYALSQIFVVSMQDSLVDRHIRAAGSWYDMLQGNALGNYRTLLEQVSLHPAMGLYLSTLRNEKEDPASGRLPDENYAREVMQLMSIGLYQLHPDGTLQQDAAGNPLPAYSYSDIAGLAKVFTGWSWYAPLPTRATFFAGSGPDSDVLPMSAYPPYHSTSAKRFLGRTIAAGSADPAADLKVALDSLFRHPNVGPFLATRLIQQLVTSNPSPAYVARVAAAFADNGARVRGDLGATVAAVLLDPEARDSASLQDPAFGKLREPVLRLTTWMRAFAATSQSGLYLVGALDSPATQLGQSPLNAPSVFNFWRPGYVPPQSRLAAAGLLGPEFQAVNEVSVAGYLNFLQGLVARGLGGGAGSVPPTTGSDLSSAYADELPLAGLPEALVSHLDGLLLAGHMSAALHQQMVAAVGSVPLRGSAAAIAQGNLERVRLAVYLTMASPEFLLQR